MIHSRALQTCDLMYADIITWFCWKKKKSFFLSSKLPCLNKLLLSNGFHYYYCRLSSNVCVFYMARFVFSLSHSFYCLFLSLKQHLLWAYNLCTMCKQSKNPIRHIYTIYRGSSNNNMIIFMYILAIFFFFNKHSRHNFKF